MNKNLGIMPIENRIIKNIPPEKITPIQGKNLNDAQKNINPSQQKTEAAVVKIKQRNWEKENPRTILIEFLEKENPRTFNARWIRTRDYGLYRHLRKKLKNQETGEIEWENFINQLPEEWQERWIRGASEEEKRRRSERNRLYTFGSAIEKLNGILKKENPVHFSSSDVKRFDKQLYSFFKENIKKEKGGIDWEKIMKEVKGEYAKRFRPPKKFEDEYPDDRYEDDEEVDELLDSNKNGLLGFFEEKNKKERDVLCLELIRLAKKGNINAEEKIIDYMELLLIDIAEKDKFIRNYCHDPEKVRERIKRCIYLYRENQPTSFVGYVYINLREEARPLTKREIELDSYLDSKKNGLKMSRHDTIDLITNEEY